MAVLAPCLVTLRAQVNAKWPNRSKASDGWIGDSAHAARKSDHNPGPDGVVEALDITHDPLHGLDASKLAESVRHDPRCEYVISNGRIAFGAGPWKKYTGSNAHTKHCHVSCMPQPTVYNDKSLWKIDGVVTAPQGLPVVVPVVSSKPILKKGSSGPDVATLQRLLNKYGAKLLVDADFGKKTLDAVTAYQKAHVPGVTDYGQVGALTWRALERTELVEPDKDIVTDVYDPKDAVKLYKTLGWSDLAAYALVANLMWESGCNTKKPQTILFEAKGDKDKYGNYQSFGAGQWNKKAGRFDLLHSFATKRGKTWQDPETQLLFLDHELHTTERKAGVLLRAAQDIETAVQSSILIWRPSVPHADKRLAIAKRLMLA
jgi:hypothetical protein